MNKGAGILLPIFSLPSEYGIGCFDKAAYSFVDFLKASGQSVWQILPIGPTGFGDSPYQSFSSFAGNPYFIDLSELTEKGWISKNECRADFSDNGRYIDYAKLYHKRLALLKKAFTNSAICNDSSFLNFKKKNKWLCDYSLFMAIKDLCGGSPFYKWDDELKYRRQKALDEYSEKLEEETEFYCFLQYIFYSQWRRLKSYANDRGIKIIGDIPIYVAYDSADVWASPQLFQLDKSLKPKAVAGCPPDGFSESGQLWGNPLYDWNYHKKTDFSWWIKRLSHTFELFDIVRIDHFRGFDEYYSIPYQDKDAKNGRWEKGPGMALFKAVEKALGKKDIIAEDLGFVTDSVRKLVKDSGFSNMKVLQFAFDLRDTGSSNDYLPHTYCKNSVCYTGTHDNQTLSSWICSVSESEKNTLREYLCDFYTPDDRLNLPLIALIMRSKSRLCIIPMQDWLNFNDDARINTPSVTSGNWRWRLLSGDIDRKLTDRIYRITESFGRVGNK